MKPTSRLFAGLLCALSLIGGHCEADPIKLNTAAFDYAEQLIDSGYWVNDGKGSWTRHQPSIAQKNEFIRENGFAKYAKWHLGIDERHALDSKARYKFPFGDFEQLHRSALLAIKGRAREYGYSEIEQAAAQLIERINSRNPSQ